MTPDKQQIRESLKAWRESNGYLREQLRAALIDMDGVLYDSMKYHTSAWQKMMQELGVECTRDEFYLYEGMTGTATIALLLERARLPVPDEEESRRLYEIKKHYFLEYGKKEPMPGAAEMLQILRRHDIKRVLVTGSAQTSLIDSLGKDYPGIFLPGMMVTALDVSKGKPEPEPYLRGLGKADVRASETIVIENAPLGVKAGKASGCFTIAVTTGPIPRSAFEEVGADLIFPSMPVFADSLPEIITCFDE